MTGDDGALQYQTGLESPKAACDHHCELLPLPSGNERQWDNHVPVENYKRGQLQYQPGYQERVHRVHHHRPDQCENFPRHSCGHVLRVLHKDLHSEDGHCELR